MSKLKCTTIILFISMWYTLNGQTNIPEVNFSGIEPLLKKNTDTVYVINFWATWCTPCRNELPYFIEAHEKLKEKPVQFYFISLDFPKQKESSLVPFVEKMKIPGQVILLNDTKSNVWINKVEPTWSGAIPATLIYKRNSKEFIEGEVTYDQLFTLINKKLD